MSSVVIDVQRELIEKEINSIPIFQSFTYAYENKINVHSKATTIMLGQIGSSKKC